MASKFLLVVISVLLLLNISKADYSDPVKGITDFAGLQKIISGQMDHIATIVFDHPECDKCGQIEPIIQKYADDNKGFTQTYVLDCESVWEDQIAQQSLPMCGPDHIKNLPLILFFEPSAYGGQPKQHAYQGGASPKELGNFLRKHMPNFTVKLNNEEEYNQFLNAEEYENKVILFTNKEKTSPLFKALGSTYRDRILFAEVHESAKEIIEKFNIESYPALYILKYKSDGTHKSELYMDDLKYDQISEYLEDFALPQKVKKAFRKSSKKSGSSSSSDNQQEKQQQQQEKKQKLPDVNKIKIDKYEKQILSLEKPVLIHITKGEEKHSQWEEIIKKYQYLFDYFTFDITNDEEEQQAKEILKARSVPGIRYLPPGTAKKPYSSFTFGPKDTDLKEIHSEFQYQIPDQTITVADDQMLNQQMQQQLMQSKVVIMYFFEKEVSLGLRVAAMQEAYQKKFGFITYKNPSEEIKKQFGVTKSPFMLALFRQADLKESTATPQDEDAPKEGDQVQAAQFAGKFNYQEISNFLNAWIEMKEGKKSTKKISELKSQEDFDQNCKGSSYCFIAILNGEPKERQEDEDTKLQEQLKIIQNLSDRYTKKGANFFWIDGTCHSEILFPLDMSDDQIPNFIIYAPGKKSFGKMIGRFESSALKMFIEKALKGQISYQPLNFNDFKIKSIDCLEQHAKIEQRKLESLEDQKNKESDDDDIMREIMEEERLKREALEKELEQGKKKRRKKKKKGKKTDL